MRHLIRPPACASRMIMRPLLLTCAVLGGVGACALAENDDATPLSYPVETAQDSVVSEDLVDKGFLQKTLQSNAEIFTWSKNQRDVYMKPVATHTCFLTRVSGQMGNRTSLAVHTSSVDGAAIFYDGVVNPNPNGGWLVDDLGPTWKLFGHSDSPNSYTAEATCVRNADFFLDPGMAQWNSPQFRFGFWGADTQQLPMWLGDAVSYLTGLSGVFNGGGEVVEVVPGAWNTPSILRLQIQSSEALGSEAVGRSFFMGYPGNPGTYRTNLVSQSGNKKTNLLRTSEGACFLTRISGDFNGSEERIRILPTMDSVHQTEWWTLETHAGGGSASATAQCVHYYQSDLPYCDTHFCG